MSRKRPNLDIAMSRCGCCDRSWRPKQGVVASRAFCPKCTVDRHAAAAARFELRSIAQSEVIGPYLLSRRTR